MPEPSAAQHPNPGTAEGTGSFGDLSLLSLQQVRGFVGSRLGGKERSWFSLQISTIKAVCRVPRMVGERWGGSGRESFPALHEVTI